MPTARLPALLAALIALAACSVGTPYRHPDVAAPAEWRDAASPAAAGADASAGAGVGAPSVETWPAADWWHGFGSERLDRLIAQARQDNDDLAVAIARVNEADAQARIAGAPLLPSLDATGSAMRARTNDFGAHKLTDTFNPELTASYEIDFWGKNRAAHAAAGALAAGSRYDRETVALTVISSVATTYFQALALRDRIGVAEKNLENGRAILNDLTLEQSVGTATGLDVAQQETAVAQLYAAIPPLREQFRQTVNALAVLIGRTPESIEVNEGSLTDLSNPRVGSGLPSQILARRPDVAAAEQQLVAANANVTVARAALFPSIDLTASGGYASAALSSLVNPANRVYSISAGLTQPIFHGGALRGQLAYSEQRYRELLATYHKTVLTAFSNVENALVAQRETAEQLERQRAAVAVAQRAYEFALTQLAAGTVNVLTVLSTENALFSAQDALVQVEYAHLQSLVDLYTALGGGWQKA